MMRRVDPGLQLGRRAPVRPIPQLRMGRAMSFVLQAAALGRFVLALLSAYPGVLVDLLFVGILLSPLWLPALVIGGLVVFFFRARSARKKPLEPDIDLGGEELGGSELPTPRRRPLLISASVMILSLILIVFGIPRRAAFLVSRPAFEPYVATAPASDAKPLGRWLGVYYVDRYGADVRGGVYFRTHAGPDGIGPDTMSYGFAYQPNPKGTPFGNSHYGLTHLVGDWCVFSASNDY